MVALFVEDVSMLLPTNGTTSLASIRLVDTYAATKLKPALQPCMELPQGSENPFGLGQCGRNVQDGTRPNYFA